MRIPFFSIKSVEDKTVDIIRESIEEPNSRNQFVKTVNFSIYLHRPRTRIGECDLRIGMNEELYYAGNIGYRIYDGWRGHHYAYEACLLLLDMAKKEYQMNNIIVTCSPENIPSHKTLEKLGGQYVRTVEVPSWHWLYQRGEKVKEIFVFNL